MRLISWNVRNLSGASKRTATIAYILVATPKHSMSQFYKNCDFPSGIEHLGVIRLHLISNWSVFFVDFFILNFPLKFTLKVQWRNQKYVKYHKFESIFNSSPKAVNGQRYPCPAWVVCDLSWRGAGQRPRRGRSPVEHRGNLPVRPSIRPSFRSAKKPKSKQWGPNLSKNSPNPSIMTQI